MNKRGCVFPMVIWPAFRMGQYRANDHPNHAPQFRIISSLVSWRAYENSFLVDDRSILFLVFREERLIDSQKRNRPIYLVLFQAIPIASLLFVRVLQLTFMRFIKQLFRKQNYKSIPWGASSRWSFYPMNSAWGSIDLILLRRG